MADGAGRKKTTRERRSRTRDASTSTSDLRSFTEPIEDFGPGFFEIPQPGPSTSHAIPVQIPLPPLPTLPPIPPFPFLPGLPPLPMNIPRMFSGPAPSATARSVLAEIPPPNPNQIPVRNNPQVRLPDLPLPNPDNANQNEPPRGTQGLAGGSDFDALMTMYRCLTFLDRAVRKMQTSTTENVSLLASQVSVDDDGNYKRIEPNAIALFVVQGPGVGKCECCNSESNTLCGRCKAAYYCSCYCLHRTWGGHEPWCNLAQMTRAQATTLRGLRL